METRRLNRSASGEGAELEPLHGSGIGDDELPKLHLSPLASWRMRRLWYSCGGSNRWCSPPRDHRGQSDAHREVAARRADRRPPAKRQRACPERSSCPTSRPFLNTSAFAVERRVEVDDEDRRLVPCASGNNSRSNRTDSRSICSGLRQTVTRLSKTVTRTRRSMHRNRRRGVPAGS